MKLIEIERKLNHHLNKTAVAFFAQRNSSFHTKGVIPFLSSQLNSGEGFNHLTGVFTAPVTGIYHIFFSGALYLSLNKHYVLHFVTVCTALKTKTEEARSSRLTIQLKRTRASTNQKILAEGHVNSNDWYGWFPVQVQATVYLLQKDCVHAELVEGSIHENGEEKHLLTAFGGFLVHNLDWNLIWYLGSKCLIRFVLVGFMD